MSALDHATIDPQDLVRGLREYIDVCVEKNKGQTQAVKPGHRVKFHWPPHPISYSFHVLTSDWTGQASFEAHGETFEVVTARTPYGFFGKCEAIWHEAKGDSFEEMLQNLRATAEPLFERQFAISDALCREGRFKGHLRDLDAIDLIKLLYCRDRDIANDARIEIETHASLHVFLPALIEVLRDNRHPLRRSAQWCVLDLFEDLPSFCDDEQQEIEAVRAVRDLMWEAEDDYARTIYKAGVVLGGYLTHHHGHPILVECLGAPSRIARRSAIHGLFHVAEWIPDARADIVATLRGHQESDLQLQEFARRMADDIEKELYDHIPEPVFDGE